MKRLGIGFVSIVVALIFASTLPAFAEKSVKEELKRTLENGDAIYAVTELDCPTSCDGEKKDGVTWDTRALYLKRKGSDKQEVIYRFSREHDTTWHAINMRNYCTYDVRISGKTIFVAMKGDLWLIVKAYEKQVNGAWKLVQGHSTMIDSDVSYRRIASAKFIGNDRIKVVDNNGLVEEWSFADKEKDEMVKVTPKPAGN